MRNWSWKDESELMDILIGLQNQKTHVDIMTIVGFMTSRQQLVDHINRNGGNVK